MKPTSPVIKNCAHLERTFAKDQPQYQPLPSIVTEDGIVITRWKMNWKERLTCFLSGNIYLSVMTFNQALQPVLLQTDVKEVQEELNV